MVRIMKAAQNISKGKKQINAQLLKLLARFDLDRPLVLREKLDIIWRERRS